MKWIMTIGALVLGAIGIYALAPPTVSKTEPETLTVPLGLPPIPWPEDNPYSQKKAELGRLLFFDKRLSSDETVSCASCHGISHAFTDRHALSQGIRGHIGTRHAPTVINSAYLKHYFWDGRAASLEEQAQGPLTNPKEMTEYDDPHIALAVCQKKIHSIAGYRKLCKEAFGSDDCSINDIAKAIATFERTVLSGNSPYDRYMAGDKQALTPEQHHGMLVFKQAKCHFCHNGPNFADGRFLNIGVGMAAKDPDLGRYLITKNEADWGGFKVPTLREVTKNYPYMHDGSIKTLEEVMDYYDKGGTPNRNLHPAVKELHLSDQDKKDLVSFLYALNGEGWQHFKEPTSFPE